MWTHKCYCRVLVSYKGHDIFCGNTLPCADHHGIPERMGERKTFWITKYALTARGIVEAVCEVVPGPDGKPKYVRSGHMFEVIGVTAFDSQAAATVNAAKQARRKIQSLDRQREKIEKLAKGWEEETGG